MMKSKPSFQVGVCSFECGNRGPQPVVQSTCGKYSICVNCVHDSAVAAGQRPVDSVVCLKCKSYDGFKAYYKNPNTSATFQYTGNDSEGMAQYVIVEADKFWKSELVPAQYSCSACSFKIQPSMVEANMYLVPFFKKHLPVKKKRKRT